MVNGLGGASGDQDTENTELMAIYSNDNQGAEKVTQEKTWRSETQTSYVLLVIKSASLLSNKPLLSTLTHSHMDQTAYSYIYRFICVLHTVILYNHTASQFQWLFFSCLPFITFPLYP